MLNVACYDKIDFIPWEWNFCYNILRLVHGYCPRINNQPADLKDLPLNSAAPSLEDLPKLIEHPKVIHFTSINPWEINFNEALAEINEPDLADEWIAFRKQWLDYYRKVSPVFKLA